jgi:transcriptional regulator with XRE-family HTH domain
MGEKDKLAKRIGSRMNTLRKQRGLTISEIAKQTHLFSSLISRIKNGQIMASVQTLALIADTLMTDIGFFFQQEYGKGYREVL